MIHRFSVKNFYSIGKKIEINFVSKEKNPNAEEMYLQAPFNRKISKISFIGGPNASGKTNILRALSYIKYLIVESVANGSDESLCKLVQFKPTENIEDTELSIEFSIENEVFSYSIALSPERVKHEILERRKMNASRATQSRLFERTWDNGKKSYSLKTRDMDHINQLTAMQDLIDHNPKASFISIFANYDIKNGVLYKISEYWRNIVSNVQIFGSRETNHSMAELSNDALKRIYNNVELKKRVSDILRKYDVGFNDIVTTTVKSFDREETVYGIAHFYKKNRIGSTTHYESSGTQRLIILLEIILTVLAQKGGVAIIDELDAFLHPDIYNELINLFTSTATNQNSCQLIFSAQNYSILSKLDKQQIFLTEKNKEFGETESWRLDDMNGINSRDNFYFKYLTGAYGGVPEIG